MQIASGKNAEAGHKRNHEDGSESIRRFLNGSLEFPRISAFVLNPDLSDGRTISQMCKMRSDAQQQNFGGGWQVNPSHEFS